MSAMSVSGVLSTLRALGTAPRMYSHRGQPAPFPLGTSVAPPIAWVPENLEQAVEGRLPSDLLQLWQEAGELRLFEDREYGQWGLIIWPPRMALEKTAAERTDRPDQFRRADLLVGEFLGDADQLLIRCDPMLSDFGRPYIVTPIAPT